MFLRSIVPVTFAAHVLEFLLIAGLVVVLGLTAAFLVGRSYVRRHWRLLHGHVAVRGILATAGARGRGSGALRRKGDPRGPEPRRGVHACAGACGSRSRTPRSPWPTPSPATPRWPSSPRCAARCSASPTSWTACSAWSAAFPPGSSRADVRRQVAEVIGAARDVQAAAVRAGSDATEPQVRSLVRHARDEVDIVSTALASMRSTARPH